MRALTLYQPWASGIVYAGKDVENRTWNPGDYRGLVLIHAGQKTDHQAMQEAPADLPRRKVYGAVIGVATLAGVHRCEGECSLWADPGRFHFELTNPQPLTAPISAAGALRLWTPDDDLCNRVRERFPMGMVAA